MNYGQGPGPFKLLTPDEIRCWIAVYAQNSDNDEQSAYEIGEWADAAVMELRRRLRTKNSGDAS